MGPVPAGRDTRTSDTVSEMERFTIECMSAADLELAIDWAAREGWNPGLGDAAVFHATDPEGFFVGRLDGRPIAFVSAVRYDDAFAFMGFYIVDPELRSQGYGGRVAEASMAHIGGCRSIGLDGVEAQQEYYARHGFRKAHANLRFRGRGPGTGSAAAVAPGVEILDWRAVPSAQLLAYDRAHFPTERDRFILSWCAQDRVLARVARSNQGLCGLGVLRPCREGWKLGPLFADTPAIAMALLEQLRCGLSPDEPFTLDVPEANAAAMDWMEQAGFECLFPTARMYLGEIPVLPLDRIFGITSLELG